MGSENPTAAQWNCTAAFIKYEIKEFIKTIILNFTFMIPCIINDNIE
jgi:hypothetical protein